MVQWLIWFHIASCFLIILKPGIVGTVQTADGTPLTSAQVHHGDHTHLMTVDGNDGRFRRLMEAGHHGMTASAPGYMPQTKEVEISENQVGDTTYCTCVVNISLLHSNLKSFEGYPLWSTSPLSYIWWHPLKSFARLGKLKHIPTSLRGAPGLQGYHHELNWYLTAVKLRKSNKYTVWLKQRCYRGEKIIYTALNVQIHMYIGICSEIWCRPIFNIWTN